MDIGYPRHRFTLAWHWSLMRVPFAQLTDTWCPAAHSAHTDKHQLHKNKKKTHSCPSLAHVLFWLETILCLCANHWHYCSDFRWNLLFCGKFSLLDECHFPYTQNEYVEKVLRSRQMQKVLCGNTIQYPHTCSNVHCSLGFRVSSIVAQHRHRCRKLKKNPIDTENWHVLCAWTEPII